MQSLDCSISTPYSRPEGLQKGAQWSATVAKGGQIALSLFECYCLRRRHSAPVAIPSQMLPVHCAGIKVVVMSCDVHKWLHNAREYADSSQTIFRTCNKRADGSSLGTRVRGSSKDCYLIHFFTISVSIGCYKEIDAPLLLCTFHMVMEHGIARCANAQPQLKTDFVC